MLIPPDRLDEEPHILPQAGPRRAGGPLRDRADDQGRAADRRVGHDLAGARSTGTIIGASKIARDITDQKRLQRELQRGQGGRRGRQPRQGPVPQRALPRAAHAAHPRARALSYLELNRHLPAELRRELAMIRRNIETEARLVDDLLDLTRISRGKVELHFEVARRARGGRQRREHGPQRRRRQVDRPLDHPPARPSTSSGRDPGRLQQVLLNLLSNAVKFTPAGGRVIVRTINPAPGNGPRRGDRHRHRHRAGGAAAAVQRVRAGRADDDPALRRAGAGAVDRAVAGRDARRADRRGQRRAATAARRSPSSFPPSPTAAASRVEQAGSPGRGRAVAAAAARDRASRAPRAAGRGPRRHPPRHDAAAQQLRLRVIAAGTVPEAMELADRQKFDLLISDIGLPDGSGADVMRAPAPAATTTSAASPSAASARTTTSAAAARPASSCTSPSRSTSPPSATSCGSL